MKWTGIILLMLSAFCIYLVAFTDMSNVYGFVSSVPIMLGIFAFAAGVALLLTDYDVHHHHHDH